MTACTLCLARRWLAVVSLPMKVAGAACACQTAPGICVSVAYGEPPARMPLLHRPRRPSRPAHRLAYLAAERRPPRRDPPRTTLAQRHGVPNARLPPDLASADEPGKLFVHDAPFALASGRRGRLLLDSLPAWRPAASPPQLSLSHMGLPFSSLPLKVIRCVRSCSSQPAASAAGRCRLGSSRHSRSHHRRAARRHSIPFGSGFGGAPPRARARTRRRLHPSARLRAPAHAGSPPGNCEAA